MISRRITSADIVAVTGLTRHQLRALLAELPGFGTRAKQARVACEYSVQDLTVLAICCRLQTRFGVKRDAVASLVEDLRRIVREPLPAVGNLRLLITVDPQSIEYVTAPCCISEGIVLSLADVFGRIERYLASGPDIRGDGQRSLEFTTASRPPSGRSEGLMSDGDIRVSSMAPGLI